MRVNLVASLLLAPAILTAAAVASTPAASDTSHSLRVSTGVTAPQVIETANVEVSPTALDTAYVNDARVVVNVLVGQDGKAQSVQIAKSYDKQLDEKVIAAVSKFRFAPATLDDQAVPMNLKLTVVVDH
jgi:TonB family protein